MIKIEKIDARSMDYLVAWDMQRELFDSVARGESSGALMMVEHPHVYTLGKSGEANNLLINGEFMEKIEATFVKVDRGGDITYHGPGQLVGYPILDLSKMGVSLRDYIFRIEEALIETVAELGIQAARSEGATGVWVDDSRKIAAIGVRASRGVTMHGFALNVNTDLNYFSYINPCGFVDRGVTSIEKEAGERVDMERVKDIFCRKFELQFNCSLNMND